MDKKLVVVSGGTKGIGRAIIEEFAALGKFDIATCSRNLDDLEALKKVLELKYKGINLHIFHADLSKKEDCSGFVEFVNGTKLEVEVLVNNAGIYIPGTIHDEEEGNLEKMIESNLYSAYRLTRGLIHDMKKRKSGHVFNICSTASIIPYSNGGSYCISKFAMLGMSKVLREEMKQHDVRVTSVLPGATLTSSWEGVDLPEERFMKPEDVASGVINAYNMSKNSVVEELLIRPQLGDIT